MNFFTNGTPGGCGCGTCDIIWILLLLNCMGGTNLCGMGGCDIIWLILILNCICGGNTPCGCK